jgi:hypothetical protein
MSEPPMIVPPSNQPGSPGRRDEFDLIVDYAVQLLVEEAHVVGRTRAGLLTGILDAANDRLSSIEEETELEDGGN